MPKKLTEAEKTERQDKKAELAHIRRLLYAVMPDSQSREVEALGREIQTVQGAYGLSVDDVNGWLATKPVVFSQRDFALWAQKLLVNRADAKAGKEARDGAFRRFAGRASGLKHELNQDHLRAADDQGDDQARDHAFDKPAPHLEARPNKAVFRLEQFPQACALLWTVG